MNLALSGTNSAPRISHLGTSAILFEAPGELNLANQRRIWALAERASTWPNVREAVPGLTNLMLILDPPPRDPDALKQLLLDGWASGEELHPKPKTLKIPIVYGGEGGPHLRDVAEGTGLSVDEVVRLHSQPTYTVYAVGQHAGYCYLGGLNPRLFMPRRKVPLVSIPAGSLSIAGMQTGVSASRGPSGWHTIGRAEISFFDPTNRPPARLKPGDIVQFVVEGILE
ncbi:5-oxoprolinase subunit PxpB [Chelativorans sp. SCAU2101]|jgi:TIGR00370 family protein|uniref:5-oxoprolinase subunit PxpB n=1 Tax=Chelativorans petroleitrophicus TaxID=2975484 RepID=A0A9X3B7V8_9HYPH|nr:5-oxoprolinase subunit PxpB [Chelativorans petroleitrophicus]MCT8992258.1 5-oxoprolinase subunit PxpB [Chelativorans petroleitrophicus]